MCVCFCVQKEAEDMAYILCQVNMLLNTETTVDATLLYIVHCCCRKFDISAGEHKNFTYFLLHLSLFDLIYRFD